ncbi:LysR family transcriptional regulator [Pectobacterium parmentieri]|uniref:LysR family transcriptional regulator n=2 Tax=Pectobacterium parmentieri TaxID=1905730 RepID=A0A0H3I0T9_PECPM|nr:LysR family transcriptional regulator [Pectobacterium parmentieri]AFI89682.1 LysR-family transcriptional regulator SinR [Pectobacterium parmentieri]MBI0472101.1 LysR family transcriptional regulator [Pectobacterium parmentieri]MBI0495866.1 LysR family transcriptional regulator [Pectobacterium parmentieri]MBI0556262.1 LysR family transcriptional regulator [Pectobacterium parmentieri]MBI0569346.1 LysR family transcriptional regulator [Pectobacterium parmentieri]
MRSKKNHLIHDWLIYIKVVEKKSFSAAAIELNLAVGSVSKSIAKLEDIINAKLLSRNAHKFEVTAAGELVYEKALILCETYHNILARLENNKNDIQGVLRLSAPTILSDEVISAWIMEYIDMYPNAVIHLLSRESGSFTSDSPEFDDLVIKSGYLESPDLIHRNMNPVSFNIYASSEYLETHQKIDVPEDMNAHRILRLNHPSLKYPLSMTRNGEEQLVTLSYGNEFISNNIKSLLYMARKGKGICVAVPSWSAQEYLLDGSLVAVLPEYSLPVLPAYLVWRYRKWHSPLFRDFSTFVEKKWNSLFNQSDQPSPCNKGTTQGTTQ